MKNEEQKQDDIPVKRTLETMTEMEVIEQCGRLKHPIEKVLNILYAKDNEIDIAEKKKKLTTPGTRECMAYHSGFDAGDFEVETALHAAASGGDPDAQKALHDIQSERIVGDAIQERFFPSDSES